MRWTKSNWILPAIGALALGVAGLGAWGEGLFCAAGGACREAARTEWWGVPVGAWGVLYDGLLLLLWFRKRSWLGPFLSVGVGIEIWLLSVLARNGWFCPLCIFHALLIGSAFACVFEKSSLYRRISLVSATFGVLALLHPLTATDARTDPSPALNAPSSVVARINGRALTLEMLDNALAGEVFRLEQRIYDARRRKLEEIIEKEVVAEEARRRGISREELYRRVVEDVTVPDEELDFYIAANREYWESRYDAPDEFRKAMRMQLLLEKREAKWKAFVRSLYEDYHVRIRLPRPSPAALFVDVQKGVRIGRRNAAVTVVEFSDFSCPICREAHKALKTLVEETREDVLWVFMDYPLKRHRFAWKAAEAARCAAEQNRYLEYRDALYRRFNHGQASLEALADLAESLGLDPASFRRCLASGRYKKVIEANLAEAEAHGIHALPTFVINGKKVTGFPGPEKIAQLIEKARSGSPTRLARAEQP